MSLGENRVRLILAGDFNICGLDTAEFRPLRNLADSCDCVQLINEPTHKNRMLDLIFVSKCATVLDFGVGAPVEKFHATVWATLDLKANTKPVERVTVLSYKQADIAGLRRTLGTMDLFGMVRNAATLDQAAGRWTEVVNDAMEKHIPKRTFIPKLGKNWMTPEIMRLSKLKDEMYRVQKRRPTGKTVSAYKTIRRSLRKIIRQEKMQHFLNIFNEPTGFWKAFNSVTGKSWRQDMPSLLLESGIYAESDEEKAEALLRHYQGPIPTCELPQQKPLNDYNPGICSTVEVIRKIKALPARKSPGLDGVTAFVLKSCCYELSPSIAALIGRCLKEANFPSSWKTAIIKPIPKQSAPQSCDDYRPIALLPIVSKIGESHMLLLLSEQIESQLVPTQFGFRQGRSTTDALIYFDTIVTNGFEQCRKRNQTSKVVCCFYDLSKAFDSVPHVELLQMLKNNYHLSDRLLMFVRNYLSDRAFCVRVNKANSQSVAVTAGVPQGSVLGPVLFSAYINEVGLVELSEGAQIIFYADDMVYIRAMDQANSEEEMKKDTLNLNNKVKELKLKMNITKCRYMLMTLSNRDVSLAEPPTVDGIPLERVGSYRYLGVHLDPALRYDVHAHHVNTKSKQSLGLLYRTVRKWAPPSILSKAYKSTTLPALLYGQEACFPAAEKHRMLVERAHSFAARLVSNDFKSDRDAVLNKLDWKPICQIVTEQRLLLMRKYVDGRRILPGDYLKEVSSTDLRRSGRTGHSRQLMIPKCSSSKAMQSPLVVMIKAWNALPNHQVEQQQFAKFRKETTWT